MIARSPSPSPLAPPPLLPASSSPSAASPPSHETHFPRPRPASTSDLCLHATDADAAAVVRGGRPAQPRREPPARARREMDPATQGHRRRRSSVLSPQNASYAPVEFPAARGTSIQSPRSTTATGADESLPGEAKLERTSDESTSEDLELDDLTDEGVQDDEETGLTGHDKGRRHRRKRRHTRLDQRIAGDGHAGGKGVITAQEKKEADQNVVKKSLINGLLIAMWYVFSLSISLYNKWMFDPKHLDFHFPLFTTCFHMLVQFTLASLVLFFLPQFRPRYDSISNPHNTHPSDEASAQHHVDSKKPLMTRMFYFTRIGPCGMATGLDIGLGNMSLKFITLTFYTMCKSSSLAFVLLFAFLFRLESPSWRLVVIIATMTAGVVMMVAGEVDFSILGFILVLAAAFSSGFRWALTQILLLRNPATSNPFSSIFYLAPIMFASLLLIAIPVEGFPALAEGFQNLVAQKGVVLGPLLLLFPGCIAFLMTASEFALLQRTSVVTLSIAGVFKEVVTILAAGVVFHDSLTLVNISGLVVTFAAIAAYNYIKIRKMREDARREAHGKRAERPSTDSEDVDSDPGDWNTEHEAYVTTDGDILPHPNAFSSSHGPKTKKGERSVKGRAGDAGADGRKSTERRSEEASLLAASKKELSE